MLTSQTESQLNKMILPLRVVDSFSQPDGSIIVECEYDTERSLLCRVCQRVCPFRDHLLPRSIRHLDHDKSLVLLHFAFPRVDCPEHGVVMAHQTFFDAYSSCSYAFEDFAVSLVDDHRSASEVARQLRVSRNALARILDRVYRRSRTFKTAPSTNFD